MARRSRKRKRNWKPKKINMRFIIKGLHTFLPMILCAGFLLALFGVSYAFALQSDLFTLQKVVVENGKTLTGNEAFMFTGLRKYQSVLSVDLKRVEQRLRRQNPQYKDVRVKRVLPDEIQVALHERAPIAQIENGQYYIVDREGVVVGGGFTRRDPNLTVVSGVPIDKDALTVGHKIPRKLFGRTIQILREVLKIQAFQGSHKVTLLDLSDKQNYKMWIDDKIEVRLSARNVSEQLTKLKNTLNSMELNAQNVRYIDLRFDDVVIGPR